jgi:hypothetical protein
VRLRERPRLRRPLLRVALALAPSAGWLPALVVHDANVMPGRRHPPSTAARDEPRSAPLLDAVTERGFALETCALDKGGGQARISRAARRPLDDPSRHLDESGCSSGSRSTTGSMSRRACTPRARAGEIRGVTGVDDAYEPAVRAEPRARVREYGHSLEAARWTGAGTPAVKTPRPPAGKLAMIREGVRARRA